MNTVNEVLRRAESAIGSPYWYACSGEKPTATLLKQKIAQFPKKWTPQRIAKAKSEIGLFEHVFDCVGFVRWACGMENDRTALFTNANALFRFSAAQPLQTLPKKKGVLLFMDGHVGIYNGNDTVFECWGFQHAALRALHQQRWTHWGKCPWIDYEKNDKPKETSQWVEIKAPAGSSPWSLAQKFLGDGNRYHDLLVIKDGKKVHYEDGMPFLAGCSVFYKKES